MKTIILKLLALLGLAPATHVAQATARAGKAADRVARLEERLARLSDDRDRWKQQHQEAASALGEAKRAARRAEDDAARARAEAAAARSQNDQWRSRADALTRELHDLRERLDESRRIGALAREHLMATEVKLDLIEAAIQVLDTRTRAAALSLRQGYGGQVEGS